jgi:alkaline phosphatase D
VLWTRLAPRPLEVGGGMPRESVTVEWELSAEENMRRVIKRGSVIAHPEWAHSVHVEVEGLEPARWYWYRFTAAGEVSAVGRTRTMPATTAMPERLRFAVASCQKYEMGYYTAFEHMAREDLDLVVHLGDYIYEKDDGKDAVRPHGTKEIFTIDDYRTRYAIYKQDPALQTMHAAVPWIVTWDDHEVNNDYAASIPENPTVQTTERFMQRRAAGYQAYYEHMPLRRAAMPRGPDMLLYRRLSFGQLASFHVLDTRQYRADQYGTEKFHAMVPALLEPSRTIMGARQRDWLFDGLDRSTTGWNIIAQQVMVAKPDVIRGPGEAFMMDKWPGYEFERRQLLRHLHDHKTRNPVVVTGDVHQNWANDLIADFDKLDSKVIASEFVGTSITSSGDGEATPPGTDQLLAENPFVKFHNAERGYFSCEVTPQQWRTDYRTVPYITRRGAPLQTPASFVIESGRPGMKRA